MHKKMGSAAAWLVGVCALSAVCIVAAQADVGMTTPDSQAAASSTADRPDLYPLPASASDAVKHGRYLAMAGDCAGCHTVDPKRTFAGGLPINTPFGTLYTTNITPDREHGIGSWTFDQFYTAMHDGVAPGWRYLYPAFPFTSFTKMSKADVKDLWAYMQTLPAVAQANQTNTMRFPFSWRPLLFFWRLLFFSSGSYENNAAHDAQWNRGAYLVEGLGHCAECHSPRGFFGQVVEDKALSGGVVDGWWAPNITGDKKDGLGNWSVDSIVQYLRTGSNAETSAFGPMGVVIEDSMAHMNDDDLKAISVYLKSLSIPSDSPPLAGGGKPVSAEVGKAVYLQHCQTCHRFDGTAFPYAPGESGIAPPLAGNPVVTDSDARNLAMVILHGSIEPYSKHRPLPYSMPAFADELSDEQIAGVVNYIRSSWGNQGGGISAEQVKAMRGGSEGPAKDAGKTKDADQAKAASKDGAKDNK